MDVQMKECTVKQIKTEWKEVQMHGRMTKNMRLIGSEIIQNGGSLMRKEKKNQRYIFASHSKSANQSSHLIKRVPTGSTI